MDIFEGSFEGIGIEVEFDENNIFSCELKKDGYGDKSPLLLSVYRDLDEMSLRISVMIMYSIPVEISMGFLMELAEKALEPLRGGIGAGICPSSKNITIYKVVSLAGKHKGFFWKIIESLVEAAEEWDEKLLESVKNISICKENEDSKSESRHLNFMIRGR